MLSSKIGKIKASLSELSLSDKLVLIGLVLLLTVETLYLINFNLKYSLVAMDQDAAKLMAHAMEIIKTGRLIIPDWRYVSTHEIDSAMLLALPLYAVTSDIGLSFALSNIVYIFTVICLIFTVFRNLKIRFRYAAATCCIVLMPYQFGMLEYLNMLFFRAGQYSIKLLVPLMAIVILSFPDRKRSRDIILSVIWLFLVFLCSFSSGVFPFVTGLLPILGVYALRFIADRKDRSVSGFRTLILALAVILSLAGIVIHHVYEISPGGTNAVMTTSVDIADRLQINLSYYLSLLNGLPSIDWLYASLGVPEVNVVSLEGIGYIFRFFLAIAVLIIALRYLIGVFGKKTDDKPAISEPVISYMTAIIAMNMIIHLLCSYDAPRYYLIEVIFMMIEAGIFLSSVVEEFRAGIRLLAMTCLIFLLAVIWYTSKQVIGTSLVSRNYFEICYEMCDYFRGQNVDNVVFLDNAPDEEICRVLLPEQSFSNYLSPDKEFVSVDWYKNTGSREYYGESSIVVSLYYDDLTPVFGEEAGGNYQYVGNVGPYKMFRSDVFCLPVSE